MPVTKRSLYYWILHRFYGMQLLLLLIIIISIFFRLVPLEMQKRIINDAIELKNYQLLFLYCGIYCAAVLLAGISKYAINYIQILIGQKILVEIRTELHKHILQLPLQFYRTMQAGTVISAMTAELNAIGFFLGGSLAIPVTSVLTYLALFGFMFSVNPLLALLSSALYPLELIIIPRLQKRYNRWNTERIQTIRKMSNVLGESIAGIQDVQSYAATEFEGQRLQSHIQKLYYSLKHLFVVKYGIKFTDNLFQSFGPMMLFLVGGVLVIRGQFTLGALVAFLSAYEKIYDPWKEMLAFYQSYQDAQVRYGQIMETFDIKPLHALKAPQGLGALGRGGLEICDVDFVLENGTRLLNGIRLSVEPGEHVALVGFSGSGKSSLVLLMDQILDPTRGTILLDGQDISTLSKEEISRNITLISQKPFLFSGSIRENLLYGLNSGGDEKKGVPDQKELLQLLRDVGLEDDVLWFGTNTVVPRELAERRKADFLKMRRLIRTELGESFSRVVEFYDVNSFLYYATIRDNLIFGDCNDGSFQKGELLFNPAFLRLLEHDDLEKDLLRLGLALARVTLDTLRLTAGSADPGFFNTTPLKRDELEIYEELVAEVALQPPQKRRNKDLLLLLALAYIPAKHTIVPLNPALGKKIFMARHYFLNHIMGVDIHACCAAGEKFFTGSELPGINSAEQEKSFIAYCSIRYLYNHSIRSNILFGSPKKGSRDIMALRSSARRVFRAHGLLDSILDIGLDFQVGSQGSRLSGGQQQKLALARGLLKNTPILILDEATSGLDNESQARVQKLINAKYRGKNTVIAVIHRLDQAPYYGKIVVMKSGSFVEEGSYETLMQQKGDLYSLVKGTVGA